MSIDSSFVIVFGCLFVSLFSVTGCLFSDRWESLFINHIGKYVMLADALSVLNLAISMFLEK